MVGRTHDIAAFTALILAVIYLPVPQITFATALVALMAAMIGGLIPDIDEASADIWDVIPVGEVLGRVLSPLFGKHRNISHSLFGLGCVYFISTYIFSLLTPYLMVNLTIVWTAFILGFLSHLIMDSLTTAGIPLFFPFKYRFGIPPIKALRIKTGGWIEKLIIFPGLLLLNIYLIWQHYHQILALVVHS